MGDEICNYCNYYISIPSSKYSFSCHHFGDGDTFESRNHLMFGFFKGPYFGTFCHVAMDQTWSNLGPCRPICFEFYGSPMGSQSLHDHRIINYPILVYKTIKLVNHQRLTFDSKLRNFGMRASSTSTIQKCAAASRLGDLGWICFNLYR